MLLYAMLRYGGSGTQGPEITAFEVSGVLCHEVSMNFEVAEYV